MTTSAGLRAAELEESSIGVFAHGDKSQMLAEQHGGVTSKPTNIELELADLADAGSVVVRSRSPNGVRVKARIYAIELAPEEPNDATPRE